MERALVIGRYQPAHNGHISIFEQMNQNPNVDEMVVGVGSSQYGSPKYLNNPFDLQTRIQMISAATKGMKPSHIVPIPDIYNTSTWARHVESLCPKFDVVYTRNPLVKSLFEQRGYEVIEPEVRVDVSATLIRQRMISGGNWQEFVPPTIRQILEEIRGSERLRAEYLKYPKADHTVDLIIEYKGEGIVVVIRKKEPYLNFQALPGGFLNVGFENLEQATTREAREETGLDIDPTNIHLLGVYSDPQRDPRGPTISTAYYTKVDRGELQAGDDAKEVDLIDPFKTHRLAFDHNKIVEDYLQTKK